MIIFLKAKSKKTSWNSPERTVPQGRRLRLECLGTHILLAVYLLPNIFTQLIVPHFYAPLPSLREALVLGTQMSSKNSRFSETVT